MSREKRRMEKYKSWSNYRLKKRIILLEDIIEMDKKTTPKPKEDNTSIREGSVNIARED